MVLFLHLLGSIGLGFYLLLPFFSGRANNLPVLRSMNRVGMYLLILQFLTGGYLASQYDPTVAWYVTTAVLLVGLFAVTGIMGKKMKDGNAGAVQTLSAVNAILLILIVAIMYEPSWLPY
ncbi:hypothetical protein SY83_21535 [Paenibacillus swuensis]|uniref:Uncharacterized protein n=1 Tax=Paenibacillus swuensis TaxID=1178515 RepID=A0A172TMZ5_9BACL|nr:hypothetical protein [Paenibacillus swuensis]ANE48435.1 hypothetical protein SY83_21535 [Paenibacillus swuensis]